MVIATLLTLAGCASDPVGLSDRAVLVRASLDVRGVRPTPEELEELDADPTRLDALIDTYLDDPRFGDRIKDLFAPAFRTRIDRYPFYEDAATSEAIGEEPLDLIATLALNDLPFSDLTRADYTVVRPILLDLWPLEALSTGPTPPEGTVLARYTDHRPAAGVLSTNALWWRHTSTIENANRGRANAISRGLLCESFLDRPIDFPRDIDITDTETIHEAIRESPACTACHTTLDPLASYLWGFMHEEESSEAWAHYAPQREHDWLSTTERAPGFFGVPGSDLSDLGAQIAGDERFIRCGVRRVVEGLYARATTPDDDGSLATHRDAFVSSGLELRSLVRSVLHDPRYRGVSERSKYGGSDEPVALKLLTPDQLGSDLERLTGYRMIYDDRDALSVDFGVRSVAGGGDQGAATSPSTGFMLVHRRFAEAAASALVDGETDGVLTSDWSTAPADSRIAELLLLTQSRTVEADGDEVSQLSALFDEVAQISGTEMAWKALLTVLLSDPERLVI